MKCDIWLSAAETDRFWSPGVGNQSTDQFCTKHAMGSCRWAVITDVFQNLESTNSIQPERMNTTKQLGAIAAASLLLASSAFAATYNDATGDLLGATSWATHLDITSVEVNNTATTISFKINLAGNPTGGTSWGEYQVAIDSILGGATSGTVPNGRPITMSLGGMDYWVRSWDTGAETYHWNTSGSFWAQDNATWNPPSAIQVPVKTSSSVTLTTTLASLGLSVGNSFFFDVSTSGGTPTDSAIDALANPNPTAGSSDWVSPYDSGANVYQYTVTAVPEPTTIAFGLLGVTALCTLRKRNG